MSVMVLDAGNSIIKAKIARRENGEIAFPHAMEQLTETEFEKITKRVGLYNHSTDYLRINGKPYVIGESAERHGLITRRSGTSRYTRDYYGVLAAAALGRLYNRSMEVSLFGSHPPGDVKFREDLMESVVGDWYIEVPYKYLLRKSTDEHDHPHLHLRLERLVDGEALRDASLGKVYRLNPELARHNQRLFLTGKC